MPGLEGSAPLDLVVTLDDATGEIYSAFLVEEEGAVSRAPDGAEFASAPAVPRRRRCPARRRAPLGRSRISRHCAYATGKKAVALAAGSTGGGRCAGAFSCAPRSGSITTRTAKLRSFTGQDAWSNGSPTSRTRPPNCRPPHESALAAGALWTAWTRLTPCPPRPTAEQKQKSGHSMCSINRTTSEARYRLSAPRRSRRAATEAGTIGDSINSAPFCRLRGASVVSHFCRLGHTEQSHVDRLASQRTGAPASGD